MLPFRATTRSTLPTSLTFARHVRYRGSRAGAPTVIMPAIRPQQSHRIAAKELGELPADMGLLPGTFIMPTGKNLPSLITSPALRLQFELRRVKQRTLDWRDKLVFMLLSKTKLRLLEPKKVALELHKTMYTAFSQGDVETLRQVCGEGLLESFTKRLMTRGRTRVEWELHKYLEPARIVSNKAHHYAGMNLSRRQAVVRIHSLQSLKKFTPQGKIVPGSDEPKEVVEYLVVEKKKVSGVESPWHVWGTTKETTANPPK